MKIRLGPSGIPLSCKAYDSISGVRRVAELGLQAMEIEFVRGVHMGAEMAKDLGVVAKELDIELSVHAPYYINLLSLQKAKRIASKKRILLSLERGSQMGAKAVTVHAGFYMKRLPEEAYEIVKESCIEIIQKAKESGLKTALALETSGKPSAFGSLEEILKLNKETGIIPCIDFAHIFARNNGSINYKTILNSFQKAGLKKLYAHFSGIEFTQKGERSHLPLGQGGPQFEPLAKEILKRKLDATIICESPLLERDALKMKRIFERLGYRFI